MQPSSQQSSVEKYPCIEPDCSNTIYFGDRDRDYYIQRGWTDPKTGEPVKPKRCRSCRLRREKEKQQQKK